MRGLRAITSLEGALVKVLDIFAGYWPVDLRDDIPVTHPHLETKTTVITCPVSARENTHLVEISIFSLFSFLFGFIEILFAVLHLGQALLVVSAPACTAALNHQACKGRF